MKNLIYTFILLFSSFKVTAQLPVYVPTNGLVGWWPFNGNANDESGNGYDLTNNGAQLTSDRFGFNGSSYSFNGTSDYLSRNLIAGFGDLTFSIWINMAEFPLTNLGSEFISYGYGCCNGMGIKCEFNTNKTTIITYGLNGNVSNSSFVPNLNTWYNFIVVKNSNSYSFYINGVLNSFGNSSVNSITGLFVIGAVKGSSSSQGMSGFFKGKLDDIGIWNRALNQAEITALYNGCNFSNVNIVPNGATTFCLGNSVSLNSNKVNAKYMYTWNLNGSPISGANSSSYIATQPGSYSLKIDSAGCSATSPIVNVNVNALPSINFSINPYINIQQNTFSLSATPTGGTYSGAGVTSSGSFNPSLANLGSNVIQYTYTDGNNCTNVGLANTLIYDTIRCFVRDTIRIAVTDTLIINAKLTGINLPNNLNTLKVYPNPANTHITIDYGNFVNMNGYKVKIVNMAGQSVFTAQINQQTSYIDVSTWTGKGIYFVQLIDPQNNTIENRKIVLQ